MQKNTEFYEREIRAALLAHGIEAVIGYGEKVDPKQFGGAEFVLNVYVTGASKTSKKVV